MSGRPAAFVDRDGTIIHDANYVRDPGDVRLLPGAAAAIRTLNERDIAVIVVTNQSGIARGYLTEADYALVKSHLDELLAAEGARIDQTYMCPHYPTISGPCDCRKPGLRLYRQAIAEHGIDGGRALFVGDRWRDVAPAAAFGGIPVLLDVASTPPEDRAMLSVEPVASAGSLAEAVSLFLATLPDTPERQ